MKITWKELTLNPDDMDFDELLSDWRWLVPESMVPIVVTALGDLFLQDDDNRVHWLDTGAGTLEQVASSLPEFEQKIVQPENADRWFLPQLIGDLIDDEKRLGPGQCYSWDVPPGLSGEVCVDNVEPKDIRVHFSLFGQIFQQTKDLPEGTPITEIVIEDDEPSE
ncbi:T6SS immunity protein Tdi1 domain-containing protein [Roseimaritima ulvae]|uniref:T6SS immunity protein Tdi1 C-terminal domain-containing protein n=1 Tax=Roseimaritima ulvae TaxID=980254 RepID=A0A5B9R317_9BACT|nr:T6SS immunity protein Tdi1 domain-containing protein [Roseimaritima ulvae]QEG40681.1 hypothetical protein UC8_26980 [Roseimaritima ulvae]